MKTNFVVKNSAGDVIKLNAQEQLIANHWEKQIQNSLGYEVSITTLTQIMKKISEQKFYDIAFAEYLPVQVGEGAWAEQLTTYLSYAIADDFETGIVNLAGDNDRMAEVNTGIDSINVKVYPWGKKIGFSVMALEVAARSGNWDLVSSKEESRKKNWDLGLQRIAFLGARGSNGAGGKCLGLLNQAGVTINTTRITKSLSSMSADEFNTFLTGIVEDYRSNCNRTAYPTHFIIPESDWNGLVSQMSATYPLRTKMEVLEAALRLATMKKDFKILPLAYADAAYNSANINKQCYVLLNYDEKSIRMNIPVDYTTTLANSLDGFMFQNAGYGQFTGAMAYRPAELLYYQY